MDEHIPFLQQSEGPFFIAAEAGESDESAPTGLGGEKLSTAVTHQPVGKIPVTSDPAPNRLLKM